MVDVDVDCGAWESERGGEDAEAESEQCYEAGFVTYGEKNRWGALFVWGEGEFDEEVAVAGKRS